jgi:hypothetical protein
MIDLDSCKLAQMIEQHRLAPELPGCRSYSTDL